MRLNSIKKVLKVRYILLFLVCLIITVTISDTLRILSYRNIPSLPAKDYYNGADDIYYALVNGSDNINWDRLNSTLDYVNHQYDVSDFHIATLLRILYEYPDKIPSSKMADIKQCLLKFRYWMDEPGENSMCYWSENHQILFASAEYLAGRLYPDEIFSNSGLTGKQHLEKARQRILNWLEMRWNYGFSEFYSTVYYNEDIAGMINLVDFAGDEEIVKKTTIIMDLLLYDIAAQKLGNKFVSVSGRAYKNGRTGERKLSSEIITDYLWNNKRTGKPHVNFGFLVSNKYHVPPVLLEIGKDTSDVVIKQSNGLNVDNLAAEGYGGTDVRSIMMQWGMEAFTQKSVIRNSITYIRNNHMFSNEFLQDFRYLDFTLLGFFHLEPLLTDIINPQSNGTALERGNTYTYKNKYYSVYTVQNYFPGEYADQQHVSGMNIGSYFSIFHTHPALPETVYNQSPNYWVGYGRLPHSVQEKNISLSIYNLPEKANIIEINMLHYTHAYFPKEKFDTILINNNYAFGKKGNIYCALIGRNKLYYKNGSTEDLIQKGRQAFWIIQAGSEKEDGSFKQFCTKILNNRIKFDLAKMKLSYSNGDNNLELTYKDGFYVNKHLINTVYPRYQSPYINANFKPQELIFRYNNKSLKLNFTKMIREFN